ncbi:MAG: hypothetical protein ACLF0G_08760 [Candidatus Brocadiia bacterium]
MAAKRKRSKGRGGWPRDGGVPPEARFVRGVERTARRIVSGSLSREELLPLHEKFRAIVCQASYARLAKEGELRPLDGPD